VQPVSEIYGSGGYDSGEHHDNDTSSAYDAWDDYDPEAELERLGITRVGERERAMASDRQRVRDATRDRTPALTETGQAEHNDTSELASQDHADPPAADQAVETEGAWRQRVTELEAANAELKAENDQLDRGLAELESENADLGKQIAKLTSRNDVLDSRLERLEQIVQDKPAAVDTDRELGSADRAEKKAKQQAGRNEWMSNEAIGLAAATGGGVLTTVADYWRYLPATYAGITASVLGVGAAAIALVRKHREARNAAHRPGH
jgi:chromosome segregation ATPase